MNALTTTLLTLHVLAGGTALLSGLIPMFARKGSLWHIMGGRIYLWSMYVVVFSALPLAIVKQNIFLGTIGIFSGYMVYTGHRSAQRKGAAPSSPLDKGIMFVTMATSLLMMLSSIWLMYRGSWSQGAILGSFGSFCFLLTWEDLRLWQGKFPDRHWIVHHLTRFGGGYIATFTAFAVVNIDFLPPVLIWLSPGLIGGVAISRSARYWGKKLQRTPAIQP